MVKIYVGNINDGASAAELRALFQKYGTVSECDILSNFGFVHMDDETAAQEAVDGLDGVFFSGGTIKVEMSRDKPGGRGGFRGGGSRGFGRGGGPRGGGAVGGRGGGRGHDTGGRGSFMGRLGRGGPHERNRERRYDDVRERRGGDYGAPPPRERGYRGYERDRDPYDRYAAYESRDRDLYDRDPYDRDPYGPPPRSRDLYSRLDPYEFERRPLPRDLYGRRSPPPREFSPRRDPYLATRDSYSSRDPYAPPLREVRDYYMSAARDPYTPPRDPYARDRSPISRRAPLDEYTTAKRAYASAYELPTARDPSPPVGRRY